MGDDILHEQPDDLHGMSVPFEQQMQKTVTRIARVVVPAVVLVEDAVEEYLAHPSAWPTFAESCEAVERACFEVVLAHVLNVADDDVEFPIEEWRAT
ncbi:hypothetical protein C5D18_14975 [Rathayibacter tritici]|nr:hypothetical protein C5D18_14975 [Rathayibacter tritici]